MIEDEQQLLMRALDAATNPVLITERTGCIVWINKAFCLLSGYSKPELVGKTPHLMSSGRQLTPSACARTSASASADFPGMARTSSNCWSRRTMRCTRPNDSGAAPAVSACLTGLPIE